jgi:hypothetical protein
MTYNRVRRAEQRKDLDRLTWSGTSVAQVAYETIGSGQFITEVLNFGTVFEGTPFFSFGVELIEGQFLVDGDYPFVTAGVSAWEQIPSLEEALLNPTRTVHYLGANVWINVASSTQYGLRWRLSFEGITPRNVQAWR